jgi:hypothetical protein
MFWLLATLPCLFLMDPLSTWFWEHLGPLPYLRWPASPSRAYWFAAASTLSIAGGLHTKSHKCHRHRCSAPTTRWPLGKSMADGVTARLKPDAPPGQYTVAVGLWNRATGARSHPLEADGQPTEQDKVILIDQFRVEP